MLVLLFFYFLAPTVTDVQDRDLFTVMPNRFTYNNVYKVFIGFRG